MKNKTTVIFILGVFFYQISSFAFSYDISPISNNFKKEMIAYGTYKSNCPVPPSRLRKIIFSYYDFEHNIHDDGILIVMDAVADNVVNIFKELYENQFPIHKSKQIELYGGDDTLSLDDNNTSCFNCRLVVGGSELMSIHSYGLAIDINPWQNPYIVPDKEDDKKALVLPSKGLLYLNRTNLRPGMVEVIVHIFEKNGFTVWGGKWNNPIDWQHFQPPRSVAKILATMDPNDAKKFFKLYTTNNSLFSKVPHDDQDFIDLYQKSRKSFMNVLQNNFEALNKLEPAAAIAFVKEKIQDL